VLVVSMLIHSQQSEPKSVGRHNPVYNKEGQIKSRSRIISAVKRVTSRSPPDLLLI